jgi:hypothetical protein
MLFIPLAGVSSGNDQEKVQEEPARPHQFDEMPISRNYKLGLNREANGLKGYLKWCVVMRLSRE